MSIANWELDEVEDILQEVVEYAENCARADEEGWFYSDEEDERAMPEDD